MNDAQVVEAGQEALLVVLQVGGPIMLVALSVGLGIALVQALTQMQEMTLSFVPKIFAIIFAVMLLAPFMVSVMVSYGQNLADRIASLG
jgi:flagellar biosynthesis protein FliQ